MRRTFIALTAVLAAALPLVLAGTADAAEAGVQAHLLWGDMEREDVEADLDRLDAIEAAYVRVDVGWSSLETRGRGEISEWYLARLDHVVAEAEERGIELILTFWETPCWASTAPASLKQDCEGSWWNRGVQRYAPRDASDYARTLAFLVDRYGGRVAAWEIWNEPNHPDFLKGGDQVGDYAELLRAAYPAAKAAHPGTTVLGGSLANSDFEFTDALLDRGVKNHFDAWSIHPYSEDRSPLDPWLDKYVKNSFIRGIPAVRRVLKSHGDAEPLWLTELGWSTCNVRNQPEAYRNCVGEDTQARWLKLAFRQMDEWRYVEVGIWFNLRDTSGDSSDKSRNFGLLEHDGSRKQAYRAFSEAATGSDGGDRNEAGPAPRLKLEARSRARGIRTRGEAVPVDSVRLKAYRYRRKAGRFARSPQHRLSTRTLSAGRFRHLIPADELRRGRWKITARARAGDTRLFDRDVTRWRR